MTKRLGVQVILFFSFLIVGGWTGIALSPLTELGGLWAHKVTLYYDLEVDLLYVKFGFGAVYKMVNGVLKHNAGNFKSSSGKSGWSDWLLKLNQVMGKRQTIEDFRSRICAISASLSIIPGVGQMCYVWTCLNSAAWTMMGCLILGCVLELSGCFVLINWAFYKPRSKDRKLCMLFFSLPPLVFTIGVAYYCYKLTQLEMMYPVTDGMLLGPMSAFAAALCILALVPPCAAFCLIGETGAELYNEQLREQKMFQREWQEEQKMMAGLENYGAVAAPPPSAYGYDQSSTGAYGYAQPSQPYGMMPQPGMPQPGMPQAGGFVH